MRHALFNGAANLLHKGSERDSGSSICHEDEATALLSLSYQQ